MHPFRRMLRSKIHRATVTHADLDYEGSITLAPELLEAAQMANHEAVWVWNVTNGNRFETYTILGEPGSTAICVNGAAAHLVTPGDLVIIAAFGFVPEPLLREHVACVVFVDQQNRKTQLRAEVAGPKRVGTVNAQQSRRTIGGTVQ